MPFKPLPGISLAWTQATVLPGASFIQYNVYRQLSGPNAWADSQIRIATIPSLSTVTYTDHNVPSWPYSASYAVTQVEQVGGDVLESAQQAVPTVGSVGFRNVFIHDIASPGWYVQLREATVSAAKKLSRDLRFVAGRSAPTSLTYQPRYRTIQVKGVPYAFDDFDAWSQLDLLSDRQTSGSTFCLRYGATGERYFVTFDADPISRADSVEAYSPTAKLTETFYQEAV